MAAFGDSEVTDVSHHEADLHTLIGGGEGRLVEFKSSACFDHRTTNRNKELEFTIAKTVAGFANAKGGTLLIGVDDNGSAVGLTEDYRLANQQRCDRDGYENWLTTMLTRYLGKVFATLMNVSFAQLDGQDVCRVDVAPTSTPVFLRGQKSDGDFYVRINNSTRLLTSQETLEYATHRWR